MSCSICGRSACIASFHSIAAQEAHEARQSMSDDVDTLRCQVQDLQGEVAALRKVVDEVPHHILSTSSLDRYEDAEYVRAVTEWRKLRDATL